MSDLGKLSVSGSTADVLGALKNLIASAASDDAKAKTLLSQGAIPKLVEVINGHTDVKVKTVAGSLLSLLISISESASDVLFDNTLLVLINLANSDVEALANQGAEGIAAILKENTAFQVLQISPYILAQIAEALESDTTPLATKQKIIAIVPLLIANVDTAPEEEDAAATTPPTSSSTSTPPTEGGPPPFPAPSPSRVFSQSLFLILPTLQKLSTNTAAASIKGDVDGLIKQIHERFHKSHRGFWGWGGRHGGPGGGPGGPGGGPGGPGGPGGGPGGPGGFGPGGFGPGGFGPGGGWGGFGPGWGGHGWFPRGGGRHHHGHGHGGEWHRVGGPGGPRFGPGHGGPPAGGKK